MDSTTHIDDWTEILPHLTDIFKEDFQDIEIQNFGSPPIKQFEIIAQPISTGNRFRFPSEILSRADQQRPLEERLQRIAKKNDGKIYGNFEDNKGPIKLKIHAGTYRVRI